MSHPEPEETNLSNNPTFESIFTQRYPRREVLKGGMAATAAAMFGGLSLTGCGGDDNDNNGPSALTLGFTAVPKSLADTVTVPAGYTASLLYALGDPIDNTVPNWAGDGSETGASYAKRAGDHHDALYWFGLNANGTPNFNASDRGLLAMNHEAPNPFNTATGVNGLYVHPNGATTAIVNGVATRTVADECIKEINGHGVSVIQVEKTGANWSVNRNSTLNRRVTGSTTMEITGPLRGNAAMVTKFSPTGTQTQGTINNCANGYTPWGTYLTCEENWAGYFARSSTDNAARTAAEVTSLNRYGNSQGARSRLNWNTAGAGDEFQRWDTSVKAASANLDFRNVINQFGYVVEIDPYNPTAAPAKRTALGRFAHEGAWPGPVVAGRPVVFYQGDDNRGDYIYKYVSTANWDPADGTAAQTLGTNRMALGAKYLDSGTLYVARFNADGSGTWLPLPSVEGSLNTRIAADAAGATRMDRPEWGAVNPVNGEVYLTLTNNAASNRITDGAVSGTVALTDAANPRHYNDTTTGGSNQFGNANGHIIRWREAGGNAASTTFTWDIYLFGARASQPSANVNISGLVADNDFSSPDGLWFGRPGNGADGLLWIQTDDGAYTDVTNCMMLAAVPGEVGDGATRMVTGTNAAGVSRTVQTYVGAPATAGNVRRFLVGPVGSEITGVDTTPDGRTMFVNIQHPGEANVSNFADPNTFESKWPGNQFSGSSTARPRSATIVITKNDGGVIGL